MPKRILGGVFARRSSWSPPFREAFKTCLEELDGRDETSFLWGLEIGCAGEHGGFFAIREDEGGPTDIEHSDDATGLIYFVMCLLRQLQAICSAPAIDYDAYLKSVPGTRES